MKIFIRLSILFGVLSVSFFSHAQAFEDKTCPVYIQILPTLEENGANAGDVAWVTQALADTIPIPLKSSNVRVVTSASLISEMNKMGQQQKAGGGNENTMQNMVRGDYVVVVQWRRLMEKNHTLLIKLKDKGNEELGKRVLDVKDLTAEANQVDAFVRKTGRDFGKLLTNRFYCIKIDPKEAALSTGEKKKFNIRVENLKGESISGEDVRFDVQSSEVGMINPSHQSLADGSADVNYEQKIRIKIKSRQRLNQKNLFHKRPMRLRQSAPAT